MVYHKTLHNGIVLACHKPALCKVKRLIEAVRPICAESDESLHVLLRRVRREHGRHHRGIRRNDAFACQSTL